MSFHFIRPHYLLALFPLAWLLWRFWTSPSRASRVWSNVCDPELLPFLTLGSHRKKRTLPLIVLGLLWLIATVALSGPSWRQKPKMAYQKQQAVVVALDLSDSMMATDLTPDRLTRAKLKLQDMLDFYKEGQFGLIVFSNEPFIVSPITQDVDTLRSHIVVLTPDLMPIGGSDIGFAIKQSQALLKQTGYSSGDIIVMTDSAAQKQDDVAAEQAKEMGYRVSVLGVGTKEGGPHSDPGGFVMNDKGEIEMARLDSRSLKRLAKSGGGIYRELSNTNADVQALLAGAMQDDAQMKKTDQHVQDWFDQGRWLVFLLLPFVALLFSRQLFQTVSQ